MKLMRLITFTLALLVSHLCVLNTNAQEGLPDFVWHSTDSTSLQLERGANDCVRKPTFTNPCGGCDGIGVYRLEGHFCRSCGFYCTTIPPSPPPKNNSSQSDVAIPPYAVINHEENPRSCIDGQPLDTGPITAAVWNPTEALDKIRPFGLAIDGTSFEELALSDPMAAYVVGSRLVDNGKISFGMDMHQGSNAGVDKAISTEYVLTWINSPADATKDQWIALREGAQFFYSYATDFGNSKVWMITVESWTSQPDSDRMIDHKKTIVSVDPNPVESLPVVASDNYIAPVYRVLGFELFSHDQ